MLFFQTHKRIWSHIFSLASVPKLYANAYFYATVGAAKGLREKLDKIKSNIAGDMSIIMMAKKVPSNNIS
jgi:hypothetical protein